jgi:predicted transcriptional regulator
MPLKPSLSPLEQDVMNIIWSRGTATAADIQNALTPQRALRDSTVRTLLSRLEGKGFLHHKVEGRTFVYSSIAHPTGLAVRAVKQILDRFCHGSIESLLVGLVNEEVVDPAELHVIAQRLSAERTAGRGSQKKGSQR